MATSEATAKRHYSDYITGPLVTPDLPPDSPGRKFPYVDHGTALPDPHELYSPEQARREWDHLWTKTWLLAGLASDAPEMGDYFTFDVGHESFIIVRSANDHLAAFYNVCHHRGNRIVMSEFGSVTDCFRCAFHGWEYGLDGKLNHILDEQSFRPETIADRPPLTSVRMDVWAGMVFICLDENAPPLHEFLSVLPGHLDPYKFENFRPIRDVSLVFDANWKVTLDAFNEVYHVCDVHPELIAFADPLNAQYDVFENGMSRMIVPRGYVPEEWGNADQINDGLRNQIISFGGDPDKYANIAGRDFRPHLCEIKRAWSRKNKLDYYEGLTDSQVTDNWNYFVFPNVTLNVFSDALMIQRFQPHPTDPEKCVYNALFLSIPVPDPEYKAQDLGNMSQGGNVGPAGFTGEERPARLHATTFEEMGYVLAQDARLVPEVQKGVKSRAFKGYRLSEQEIRIRHMRAELDHYLRGEKW
jgi:phenylpropionate dioxygenase-like ring-hydroxylating dioxygenase large terminal subunit